MPRPAPKFIINLASGSVSFHFSPESAQKLQGELQKLMESLRLVSTKTSADGESKGKAAPQPQMEYQHTGDVFLEIFCNPNIWATPFVAKVLITLRDDRLRLTTEAELSRLMEDVGQYLEAIE